MPRARTAIAPPDAPAATAPLAIGPRALRAQVLPLALEEARSPRLGRVVIGATALLLGLFALWAAITRVPEIAVAQGSIAPADPVAPVQHLEGGIVEAVLVADGEAVTAGAPLLRLAGAAAQAELDQLRVREAGLHFQSARLRAFLDDAPFVPEEGAFPLLAADQQAELEGRLRTRLDRALVLRAQLGQRQADAAGLDAQLAGLARQHALQANELALRERLLEQGLTTRIAVLEVRRAVLAMEAELGRLDAAAAAAQRAIAEAEARLAEADSTARDEAARDISRINRERAEVEGQLRAAYERVGRLTVLAPADGTVKGLVARSPGQVVQPGQVLMELVPQRAPLVVEARLSPRDVGFARIGQPVTVKVQAFDYARYGTLDGQLAQISATTTADEHGQPWYAARITLAAQHVGHAGTQHRLLPGMTVQADIVTGGKTLLQYLLKPVHAAMSEGFRER
jgi:HlyD family secretion protein/adhesin transport system membrane fusion protein